ncbi:unnamed protein product, partial [Sphenostylis stenocarpa]
MISFQVGIRTTLAFDQKLENQREVTATNKQAYVVGSCGCVSVGNLLQVLIKSKTQIWSYQPPLSNCF